MSNRAFLLAILGFSAVTFGAFPGSWDVDLMEARNFVTALEMVQDGNWWETTMNGLPRLEKPPLPTWLTAVFGSLSADFPVWLLRMPAMLIGMLLVVWTYLLGKEIFDKEHQARWSAFVAASALIIIQMARTGSWDIYFVSFGIGSFYYLYKGLKHDRQRWRNFALGGLLFGCSVLSKGPVAFVMLVGFGAGVMLMEGYAVFLKRWKEILLAGVIIGIVGFGWPVYHLIFQPEASQAVIDKESVTWTTKHVKPFYFYLNFPIHIGIWALAAVLAIIPPLARKEVGRSYWMLLTWLVLTLLLLSLLPMKKERYLLPAMPVVALLIGGLLAQVATRNNDGKAKGVFWGTLLLPGIAFLAGVPALIYLMVKQDYSPSGLTWAGTILLTLCGGWLLLNLFRSKWQNAMLGTGFGIAIICASLLPAGEELFYKHPDFKSPSELLANPELQNREIYTHDSADMRVVFALRQKLPPLSQGLKKAENEPIAAVLVHNPEKMMADYPNFNFTLIDSSDSHKISRKRKTYAYLISKK